MIKTREEQIREAKDKEQKHRDSGYISCFKCGRVSGIVYTNAKTGVMSIISLKKAGDKYICTECVI